MRRYEVIVGNIGTVYAGPNRTEALETYKTYVDTSTRPGRAEGEVSFMVDGELEFWFDITPEEQIPTAEQYKVLQALRILMDHGLEDDGVEAVNRLLARMGYHLFDSQE